MFAASKSTKTQQPAHVRRFPVDQDTATTTALAPSAHRIVFRTEPEYTWYRPDGTNQVLLISIPKHNNGASALHIEVPTSLVPITVLPWYPLKYCLGTH
ncbi:hypothetical protein PMIN06_010733 [Paraphaeosphaeria minitans]